MHDQDGAQDFAQQNADKGAHLDQAITADQFLAFQLLRQIRILDGAEQGRMHAHAHHGRYQQPQRMRHPACGGHGHDGQLHPFDETRQARLFKLVGQLARRGRKHDIRQDEQAGDQVSDGGRVERGPAQRVIGEDHHQRRLEQIVVEGAKELGPEEGPETALRQ